jgi:GTP cyclohydrolase II
LREENNQPPSPQHYLPPPSPLTMPSVLSPLPQLPLPSGYLNVHDFSGAPSHATSQVTSPMSGSPRSLSRSDSLRSMGDVGGWGGVPPSIISPAFTPATTPGTPNLTGVPVDESEVPKKLMKELPEVSCIVRARIPT